MNILFRRLRLLFSVVFALCIIVPSAKADTACAAGNLSMLMGTTCDIGSLQFTFSSLSGSNAAFFQGSTTETDLFNTPWSASDFTLTPVTGGFTLSMSGGQTITAPTSGPGTPHADDVVQLDFTVTDLDGDLASTNVTGTTSESGSNPLDDADILGSAEGLGNSIFAGVGQEGGVSLSRTINSGSPFSSGVGSFDPFVLEIEDGTASWGGSSTITFDTVPSPVPTPEPSSLALLGSGALLLGAEIRRRYRTIR